MKTGSTHLAGLLLCQLLLISAGLPAAQAAPHPPPAIPLTPNAQGYVRVETKSGPIRCSINAELVACQTTVGNWPRNPVGQPFHVVSINDNGDLRWADADLGALEGRVTLDYQTYTAQGWTIVADRNITTFTNDHTGRGMSVSDQAVEPF